MPPKTNYEQKYFDEKFQSISDSVQELKQFLRDAHEKAENANQRIDRWENRVWGIVFGSGIGGGGIVATIQHIFK